MTSHQPIPDGDTLLAAMAGLVERLPADGELRADASALADRLATFVGLARLALARYQLLFDEAPDPYVVTDRDGTITEANAAARTLLGGDERELVGTGLISFVARGDRAEFEGWLGRLRAGEPEVRWDVMLEVDDTGQTPMEIHLADDLDGIGYRWMLRDQQMRTAVERHLRDVAETEHDAADDLRAEAQVRTAFLIALSHDLRSPLGAVVHQAELLTKADLDPALRRRSIETLSENAGVLGQMMEDLVDIERHAHGELQLDRTETPLSAILDAVEGDGVQVDMSPEFDDASAAVDLRAIGRALRSIIRASRRRYSSAVVRVSGRVTNGLVEITVGPVEDVDSLSPAAKATRMVETRLTAALVEAHGGSMTVSDRDLVIHLPRLR